MDDSTPDDPVFRDAHYHREIRVVVTTARAALRQVDGDTHKISLARTRALRLLAVLEQKVLLDGRDPFVLGAVANARRELLPAEDDLDGRDN